MTEPSSVDMMHAADSRCPVSTAGSAHTTPSGDAAAGSVVETTAAYAIRPRRTRLTGLAAGARWGLAGFACLWMALCTAVGPLYWVEGSIADWSWANTAYFLVSFAAYLGIVILLVRWARRRRILPPLPVATKRRLVHLALTAPMQAVAHAGDWCRRIILRGTDRWWKLFLILLIGWLWVPTTLLSAFGADVRSQAREFSWAWNQWLGVDQPYIGFFSFVPMDIYPTAHYLWPEDPTYLTDQHNIVLTVCYGAAAAVSRYLTGSNDAGFVALSAIQFVFAAFCCAATANRFFNLPFLRPADGGERIDALRETGLARPAGALQRFVILLFFLVCPLAVFATISLTKSPLFAFSFVWWFGVWYELHMTRGELMPDGRARRLKTRSWMAFAAASCVMLISAKYAWYIIVLQILLALIADRRRWHVYVTALLLPTVLIHGGVVLMIQSGLIINGDPIESRGIQLQQIARVAKLNPEGIPDSAAELLEPIFNLDQMADAYRQDDADPVKSSGIQSKKVSYKWRTVTEEDMAQFNTAWAQIVAANPVIALDALLAKCYGYFDVTASPYTSMDYYVDSIYVQNQTEWIKDWCHDWRASVAQFARDWGAVPVFGWLTHGNLYVSLTLLIGAAEVVLRRWRTLAWHIPLALLMGVMITAPANNFERHMLPVAFCFGFLCLTFWRESLASRHTADGMPPNSPNPDTVEA